MYLAVDDANVAAVELYRREGFRLTERRDVCVRVGDGHPAPATGRG
jgi:ribosomal protein S18 acetylase RimI-like enzyme